MRIISYFRMNTTTGIGVPSQKCRLPLTAGLLAILISLVAFPVNAQSHSLNGCRRTDSQFLDRLRATTDWLVGLEFPLFSDSTTCRFESKAAEQSPEELPAVAGIDLEQEILQSVCEVYHLDPCEAFTHLWAPPVQLAESKPSTTVQVSPAQVVRVVDRSYELGFGIATIAVSQVERLRQEVVTQSDIIGQQLRIEELPTLGQAFGEELSNTFRANTATISTWLVPEPEHFAADRYRQGWMDLAWNFRGFRGEIESQLSRLVDWAEQVPVDLPELHWPTGSLVNALNIGNSSSLTPSSWSVEPSIQPIPTASYIGLQRAIDRVMQNLGVQIRSWKNRGELAANGAAWLAELQNEAFERIVLDQFDAILR